MIQEYIRLLRPKHYIKNLLCLVPLFFSGQLLHATTLLAGLVAAALFSLSASIVYIFNDIMDREKDQKHPIKQKRPIASGKITVINAYKMAFLLILLSILLVAVYNNPRFWTGFSFLVVYILMNLGYSIWFKHIPIIDVMILSFGFLLRILYGAYLCQIELSSWLLLTVMVFALYMSLGKRRNELERQGDDETRPVLRYYNYVFLDRMMQTFLTLGITFYSLWAINMQSPNLYDNIGVYCSILFVIFICMKYQMIIEGNTYGDPVEVLLSDKILIFALILYGILMFLNTYAKYI